MRIWIVSCFRLAHQREIVSQPPENILLTVTADPVTKRTFKLFININLERLETSTWNGEDISCKAREIWELRTSPMPPLKWITSVEVLLRKIPELLQFIGWCVFPLVEVSSEVLLRWSWSCGWRGCCRQVRKDGWCWCCGWDRNLAWAAVVPCSYLWSMIQACFLRLQGQQWELDHQWIHPSILCRICMDLKLKGFSTQNDSDMGRAKG